MQEAESLSQNMNRKLSSVDCSKRGHLDKKTCEKSKISPNGPKKKFLVNLDFLSVSYFLILLEKNVILA